MPRLPSEVRTAPPPARSEQSTNYLPAEASAQAGKKKSGARKIRNANKIFL